jgi:hypothetical protein
MFAPLILASLALVSLTLPARAEAEGPAAVDPITQAAIDRTARARDEAQVGDYVPPFFEPRSEPGVDELRGKPLPVPGLGGIRHKPGSGVWLGEAPAGGNVFLNGSRSKVSIDLKLGF